MRKKKLSYFEFLYEMGFNDYKHYELARYLYSLPFEWSNPRDENRMYDGIAMRREFEEEDRLGVTIDISTVLEGEACTMLEFFIGFAYRLVRDMFNDGDITVPELIKKMFFNLDIWDRDDDEWIPSSDEDVIDDRLERWVIRDYDYFGEGGLFIVPDAEEDLRHVEMWVQASWWYNFYYC